MNFVKTKTIEMADCKGFQCVHCFNIIQTFKLPEEQIKKNRQMFKLIIGGKNNEISWYFYKILDNKVN